MKWRCVIPAEAAVQVYSPPCGNLDNMEFSYVLDCRLRGSDTLDLVRQGRDELLHSAKML